MALGQVERAARLFGAADALCATIGLSFRDPERATYERAIAAARAALGEAAYGAAWEAGRNLSQEDAVAEAEALGDHVAAEGPDYIP